MVSIILAFLYGIFTIGFIRVGYAPISAIYGIVFGMNLMKNDGRFNYIEVRIREVESNKVYDSREFYIGGGFYIE